MCLQLSSELSEFLQDNQTFIIWAKNTAKLLEFTYISSKHSSPRMETQLWWLVSRAVKTWELSRALKLTTPAHYGVFI